MSEPQYAVQYRKHSDMAWLYARPASRDMESATYKKNVFWTSTQRTRHYCFLSEESSKKFASDVLLRAREIWGETAEVRVVSKAEQMLR